MKPSGLSFGDDETRAGCLGGAADGAPLQQAAGGGGGGRLLARSASGGEALPG